MTFPIVLKTLSWWAAILVLAILNGAVREKLLIPALGLVTAQMLSGLILSGLVLLVAFIAMPGLGRLPAQGYWRVGAGWLVMTLIFEFSFGLYVQHKQLSELLGAYTFQEGNLWPVVLASTLVSPRLAARLRGLA